jgi:RimJ/RimL family protein N-acetyltransferase
MANLQTALTSVIPALDYPAALTEMVLTASGRPVLARPVRPDDADALQTFFRSLSANSRRNRLFGPARELPHDVLDCFTHVDYHHHFALVATSPGSDEIIGEARFVMVESGEAEFAVTISDAWQGNGIGALLLSRLICRAKEEGIGTLFGDVLLSNLAMQRLGRKLGFRNLPGPPGLGLCRLEMSLTEHAFSCADVRSPAMPLVA